MALSQEDYMRAIVGDDDALWKPLPGFFTPGTPLYTEAGGEILKGKRDLDRGQEAAGKEAGYKGEPVVLRRGAATSRSPRRRATSPPTC